ncbi:MAG: hypothetical protein R2771_06695 [Saprospiraceae bacterium]
MKFINIVFIGIYFLTLFNSCQDPCKSVNCENGSCDDGKCVCDFGWTGDNCETIRATLYKGFYEGPLSCGIGDDTIVLKVENVGNSLTDLKMHTVGLIFNVGVAISFDDYTLTATIDSAFSGFTIDTLPVTYNISTYTINGKITGSGIFNSEDEIDLTLKALTDNPLFPEVTCTGTLKK